MDVDDCGDLWLIDPSSIRRPVCGRMTSDLLGYLDDLLFFVLCMIPLLSAMSLFTHSHPHSSGTGEIHYF